MTYKMDQWKKAKKSLADAEEYLGMVGKAQKTTAKEVVKLHSVDVTTAVHYEDSDGSKNYHGCKEFDIFLAKAISNNFSMLRDSAINLMRDDAASKGKDARNDV